MLSTPFIINPPATDVIALLPRSMRDSATQVLVAIAKGISDAATQALIEFTRLALQVDPANADSLDFLGEKCYGVPRGLNELTEPYRARILAGPSQAVTPAAMKAGIDAILAPIGKTCDYIEHPDDDGFVFDNSTTYGLFPQGTTYDLVSGRMGGEVSWADRPHISPYVWVGNDGHATGTWRLPAFATPGTRVEEAYVDTDVFIFQNSQYLAGVAAPSPTVWDSSTDSDAIMQAIRSFIESNKAFGIYYWLMLDPLL